MKDITVDVINYVKENPGKTIDEVKKKFPNEDMRALSSAVRTRYLYREMVGGVYRYYPVEQEDEIKPLVTSPTQTKTPRNYDEFGLQLERVMQIGAVNARSTHPVRISQAPLTIEQCESIRVERHGISMSIPLTTGLILYILREVPEHLTANEVKAVRGPYTITVRPKAHNDLIVDGVPVNRDRPFSFPVPKDRWLVISIETNTDELSIYGDEIQVEAAGVCMSSSFEFDDEHTLTFPLLWPARLTVGGRHGERNDTPYLGVVIPETSLRNSVPKEVLKRYEDMKSQVIRAEEPEKGNKTQYAALLTMALPEGARWVTWQRLELDTAQQTDIA